MSVDGFVPPEGARIADGVWRQLLPAPASRAPGWTRSRPALFLDRDGVVVEEVDYLHEPDQCRLEGGAAALVARANARNLPVVVVTNQAGIGYGRYGWSEFAAVEARMIALLAAEGAWLDGVYACPFHAKGVPPYHHPDHPARKPGPGMLLAAAEDMGIDLGRSWIVGDRASDLGAGRNAEIAGGVHVLTGHGGDEGERARALALADDGFKVVTAPTIADVAPLLPLFAD